MGNDPNEGSERDTYNPLYVSHELNSGFPTDREVYGNGAAIVLVGVTPDQGAEESSAQGKAWQGVQEPRGCWRVMRSKTSHSELETREPCTSKGVSTVRGGTVGNVPGIG